MKIQFKSKGQDAFEIEVYPSRGGYETRLVVDGQNYPDPLRQVFPDEASAEASARRIGGRMIGEIENPTPAVQLLSRLLSGLIGLPKGTPAAGQFEKTDAASPASEVSETKQTRNYHDIRDAAGRFAPR